MTSKRLIDGSTVLLICLSDVRHRDALRCGGPDVTASRMQIALRGPKILVPGELLGDDGPCSRTVSAGAEHGPIRVEIGGSRC